MLNGFPRRRAGGAPLVQHSTFNIQHSTFRLYLPAARLFAGGATVTAAATLFALPQGLVTRTQYCVAALIGGVTNAGALPPTGWVKSSAGPRYHWYASDVPLAPTLSVALVPASTATSR